MATVYRRTQRKPVPVGAAVVEKNGQRFAVWTDAKGRHRATLSSDGKAIVIPRPGYVIQYFDEHGKRRKESVRCGDLDTAKRIAADREKAVMMRRKGYVSTAQERHANQGRRTLAEHLQDFRTALHAKDDSPEHANQTADRASRVMTGCKFERIADISATAVQSYLADMRDKGRSIQTSNHYLRAAKQFTRWLHRDRRTGDDPLYHLSMGNVKLDRRHDRRALSVDEMQRLVEAANAGPVVESMSGPDRAMMYILSAWTGFRRRAISSLTLRSFSFDGDPPSVLVAACYSKRRRADTMPLHLAVVELLRAWLATKSGIGPDDKLFNLRTPGGFWRKTAKMMQTDLQAARKKWLNEDNLTDAERAAREQSDFLTYQNDDGLFADFHANRHTFVSNLGKANVSLTMAQKLARHHDPKLTANIYTHLEVSDQAGAIAALPPPPVAGSREPDRPTLRATGTEGQVAGTQRPVNDWQTRGQFRGQSSGGNGSNVAECGGPTIECDSADENVEILPLVELGDNRRHAAKAHLTGLEPVTFGSVDRCSIQLS